MAIISSSYLITGGVGSLGTALVDRLLKTNAKKIVILDNNEWQMSVAKKRYTDKRIRYFLGDVRDYGRLKRAFNGIDFIIHTAALKHVDLGEGNPMEMVKTNIEGTENVIQSAIDCKVKKVLCISTDKACNPNNLYGATKLCSEKITVDGNVYSGKRGTLFSAMRCGNFIGSKGSVVEYYDSLVSQGKKQLPLTDEQMTRFWITLPEAAEFTLLCLRNMQGGEIYAPKIPAYSMKKLISERYGMPYKIIGIRPGEKLYELMISDQEPYIEKDWCYIITPSGKIGKEVSSNG